MSILPARTNPGNRGYIEAAFKRMGLSETIARDLESAALTWDDAEGLAASDLLRESARPDNIFTAEDLSGSDGTLFDGYGSLTSANTRLDPEHIARAARRARKQAVEYLNRCKPQAGEHLQLLTVTMPKSSADFALAMTLLRAALVLLKKRKWFKENVRGAVIGNEFTRGQAGEHWHTHAHLLCRAKWISWRELGEQWTDCLESAARRLGVEAIFAPTTIHARAVVDVKPITSKGLGVGTLTQDEAVRRVCGYILKGSDLSRVPQAQKLDVLRVLDNRRLFETYGECNFRKGRGKKNSGRYLDYKYTVDGSDSNSETSGVKTITKPRTRRTRRASLKTVGAEMIRQGKRQEWRELVKTVFRKRRAWRMVQIAQANPHATFTTLDGRVWQGEAHW
jgi:hypothetical protein